MINTYKKYLFKKFSKKLLLISVIFFILVLIINLIEETSFLKESETSFVTPILLTILNGPSLLYEMFPFIFLISTQFFFIEIYENREIYTLKQFGIDNFTILRFLSSVSFVLGFIIIISFYNFSSILKNEYLKIERLLMNGEYNSLRVHYSAEDDWQPSVNTQTLGDDYTPSGFVPYSGNESLVVESKDLRLPENLIDSKLEMDLRSQ